MKKNRMKPMTVAEAGDFFDEHDIFEFEGVEEVKDIAIDIKKKKYVGIDLSLYNKIKSRAKKLHITEDSLIQDWLKEKVR